MHADVVVTNHGTIILFEPRTEAAREWIDEHVTGETTWFAGALAVEPRFADDLAAGMLGDGLEVV